MLKIKFFLFSFVLWVSICLSACSQTNDVQGFLQKFCSKLKLTCSETRSDSVDRYSLDGIKTYQSYSTNISWWFDLHKNIQSYFESKWWAVDLYNMADGIWWSLVWYSKKDISCHILWSWELDEDLDFTWSGNVSINCFNINQATNNKSWSV